MYNTVGKGKLLFNHYMITQNAIYDENNMNYFPDQDSLEAITQSIYNKLETFYKPKKVYVWTSFDWFQKQGIGK
jgi:hypothetical protein